MNIYIKKLDYNPKNQKKDIESFKESLPGMDIEDTYTVGIKFTGSDGREYGDYLKTSGKGITALKNYLNEHWND